MKESSREQFENSLRIEVGAISDLSGYLDAGVVSESVDILSHCAKIITCASGSSGIAAKKFAHSLCCVERPAVFLSPSEAVHGGLGILQPGDVMIMLSRGGKTTELFPIADVCRKKGCKMILVTENPDSPLAEAADIVILLKISRESDKYNIMATASFVASIALFDALLAAIMEETGYRLEQFALIHPGGAVGAELSGPGAL